MPGSAPDGPAAARRRRARSGLLRVRRDLFAWAPVLILIGVCTLLAAGGEPVRQWGRYERAAIAAGQLWRLVTGHLVHLGASHMALDLTALVLIRLIIGTALSGAQWFGATVASMAAIDAGLYFGTPEVAWYVGLSGVLHGLLAAGAVALIDESGSFAAVIGLGIVAKLAWEHWLGPLPFSETATGGTVVTAAHLYGALGGAAFGFAARAVRGRRDPSL